MRVNVSHSEVAEGMRSLHGLYTEISTQNFYWVMGSNVWRDTELKDITNKMAAKSTKPRGSKVGSKMGEAQIYKEDFVKWAKHNSRDMGSNGPPNLDPAFNFTFKAGDFMGGPCTNRPPDPLAPSSPDEIVPDTQFPLGH